jgi:hypothetical protein
MNQLHQKSNSKDLANPQIQISIEAEITDLITEGKSAIITEGPTIGRINRLILIQES